MINPTMPDGRYTAVSIPRELYDELKADKPDHVTWEYYIRQLYQTSDYVEQ